MGKVISLPALSALSLTRQLQAISAAGQPVPVKIRFHPHDDPDDLEQVRWDLQGNIQRRAGISSAKGFTQVLAASGDPFRVDVPPQQLKRFVREVLPYVESGAVSVCIAGHVLARSGLKPRRTATRARRVA